MGAGVGRPASAAGASVKMGPKPMSHTQSASLMTALGTQEGRGRGEGVMELVTEIVAVRLRVMEEEGVRVEEALRVEVGLADGPAMQVAVPFVVLADSTMFLLASHTQEPTVALKMPLMSGAGGYALQGTQAAMAVALPSSNRGA